MRRLVSVSSIGSPLCGELVQGDVILDVFRDEVAVLLRHGLEIERGEDRIGSQVGELAAVDDVAQAPAGDVGFEVGLDRRNGRGFVGLGVGDELGELLFQQLVLGLEAGDQSEDLFQDLAQGQAAIHGGCFPQLIEGVVLLRLVEDLAVHVVDHALPLASLDGGGDGIVDAHDVLELLEKHAIDLHALVADDLLLDHGEDVGAEVFVGAAHDHGAFSAAFLGVLCFRRRELQHFVVVERFLEVFAVGEEVEELVRGLARVLHAVLEALVKELFQKVMLAGAAAFDLDEVGGLEDRAEQSEVEQVGAVVAGGHHADRHADPSLAGLVGREEVARTEQVVVAEVDRELLGIGNLAGDLDCEVRLVLARVHAVGYLVQDLSQLGRVVLADGKDDRLADLTADGVPQGVFKERLAEELIGGIGEKALLELALLKDLLLILAGVVGERDDESLVGKQLSCDACAGIHDRGIDQVALFHAVQQGVAESRLAVLAPEGAVGVEEQTALALAWVAGSRVRAVEPPQVVAGRGGQDELPADEVVEHCAGVATDGAVRFVGDHQVEVGRREELLVLVVEEQRLHGGDDDLRAVPVVPVLLVDDRLEVGRQ